MGYTEIFKDIIRIIESDYSGFIDKKNTIELEKYVNTIESVKTNSEFLECVDSYLHQFKD